MGPRRNSNANRQKSPSPVSSRSPSPTPMSHFVTSKLQLMENVEEFSGESVDLSIGDFFENIDMIGSHANWSLDDKLLIAKLRIKGKAAKLVRENVSLKRENSYENFKKRMSEHFEIKSDTHLSLRQLLLSHQRPSESVRQFAARLEALSFKTIAEVSREDASLESGRKQNLLNAFVLGLKPNLKRLVVIQNHKKFVDAKRHAILEEDLFASTSEIDEVVANTIQPVSQSRRERDSDSGKDQTIRDLTQKLEELTKVVDVLSRDNNSTNRESRECFFCHKRGHLAKQCRLKQGNGGRGRGNRFQGPPRFQTSNLDPFQYGPGPSFNGFSPYATPFVPQQFSGLQQPQFPNSQSAPIPLQARADSQNQGNLNR